MTTKTTAKCERCGRTLTSAKSIADGKGRTCKRLARQEAAVVAAGFKPATVAKAKELIADGGIVAIRGRRVFRAVSSDGTSTYLTAPQACGCPAGLKSRTCYHVAAATLLAA